VSEPVFDVVIDGMGSEGDGVGRLADGRVVFVPATVPGDRVRIELNSRRRGVLRGGIVEVLEPSADRIEGRCRVEACGGCPLRDTRPESQARFKRDRVLETLRRIGNLDVAELLGEVNIVGHGWRYRHRVRLHAVYQEKWKIGYFARGSHDLAPLQGCPVLWRELEQVATSLARELARLPPAAGLRTVEIAFSRRDDRAAARITGDGLMREYRRSLAWLEESGLGGVDVRSGGQRWRHGNVELRYDHAGAGEFDVRFEPGLFTQANPEMNDRLVDRVSQLIRPQQHPKVLELHAGIGNFTLPVGRSGAEIVAVERDRRSAILCRRNVQLAGVNANVIEATDEDALADLQEFAVVLLDPPRAGARVACEALAARGPERVVYVSCDPATFARDARTLNQGGYAIASLDAFDMFPETPHVEVLALFSRTGSP
jgi:23S rRNA (uracil1939-C5)-methyltransferase